MFNCRPFAETYLHLWIFIQMNVIFINPVRSCCWQPTTFARLVNSNANRAKFYLPSTTSSIEWRHYRYNVFAGKPLHFYSLCCNRTQPISATTPIPIQFVLIKDYCYRIFKMMENGDNKAKHISVEAEIISIVMLWWIHFALESHPVGFRIISV